MTCKQNSFCIGSGMTITDKEHTKCGSNEEDKYAVEIELTLQDCETF